MMVKKIKNKWEVMYKKMWFKLAFGLVFLVSTVTFSTSLSLNNWMPKWEVGDWWIVERIAEKSLVRGLPYPHWAGRHQTRFEVIGIEEVKGENCYVVERNHWPIIKAGPSAKDVFYFRKDDFQLVKHAHYTYYWEKLKGYGTKKFEYTQGTPFIATISGSAVDVPVFPLVCKGPTADSLSKFQWGPSFVSIVKDIRTDTLREVYSGPCGMVSQDVEVKMIKEIERQFADIDSIVAISTTDCYYVVLKSGSSLGEPQPRVIHFVNQIWVPVLPWPLYQEIGNKGEDAKRRIGKEKWVIERKWLIDYSGLHK